MNLRSTCGIVLRVLDHGEADKLVTWYCPELGRVTGIAKGARKSKRRFVNKLEQFSHLHLLYRPPRGTSGLLLISEAELLHAHLSLRQDFRRYIAAMYLCDLLLHFTRDNDPDPQLFALLQWSLLSLDRAEPPLKVALFAHLHLLATAGYRPELTHCGSCRRAVTPGRIYALVPAYGTLRCNACGPTSALISSGLSVQTLRFLASAQTTALDRLNRLQPPRHSLVEALPVLHRYTHHLLQQDIHSWPLFCSLFTLGGHALTDSTLENTCCTGETT